MSCVFCCRISTSAKRLGITFHSFPKDDKIKNAWIKECVSRGCVLEENIDSKKLCSNHFTPSDYEEDSSRVRRNLKKEVVPTRFSRKPYVYCIACNEIGSKHSDILLHEFPENSSLRKQWINACRQNGCNMKYVLSQHALCSKHFSSNCFIVNGKRRKYLKNDAVPQIFFSLATNSVSCSVEQSENSITNANFVIGTTGVVGNSTFCSCENKLTNSHTVTKHVENTSAGITVSPKSSSASCSVKQCEDSITNSNFDSISGGIVYAASCTLEPCDDVSKSSDNVMKCVENTSTVFIKGAERCLTNSPASKSSAEPVKKLKIWRPARVGDLREEHFSTPEQAKRNFHLLSDKCKQYQNRIAKYRTETWRLKRKIKMLENLCFQLTEEKSISEEVAGDIIEERIIKIRVDD